ncbi:MAG: cation:proton antiporter [Phycisphaerales bacterium]|nr:MAG: cation:proton antiporter [Phycisphaerales bacterium]
MFDLSFLHVSPLTLLAVVALVGFYMGHASRRIRLPSLIGYMILGVILGPSVLHLFEESTLGDLSFITEVSLGFVAFSIGSELSLSSLRSLGPGIASIILVESFLAFAVVLAAVYLLTRDLPLAIVFGSVAPASAPAGTVAVIHEYRAKGTLTKALYAVVGFDDGLAIIIFGFAAALAKSLLIGSGTGQSIGIMHALLVPLEEIALSLVVGGLIGLLFCQMVRRLHSSHDIFIIVFGAVLLATGLSIRWHLSLILTNMVVGFVLINTRREALAHRVMAPLREVMPLLFILFFCLAGAHLKLSALPSLGLIGVVYVIARAAGLMGGAYLGGAMGHVEEKVRKYVGMGILSQAGVAIGLSLIVKHEFAQLSTRYNLPHAAEIGATVLTTITATCIFFEIIGPILTKIALEKAGEIPGPEPKPPAVRRG